MNDKKYNECIGRLEKIGKVLQKIPPEVRGAAFSLFEGYITGNSDDLFVPDSSSKSKTLSSKTDSNSSSMEKFFSAHAHDKPADNVKLMAAFHYKDFGTEPFLVEDLQGMASDVGLTVPKRMDMTLDQAKIQGRKLFARAGAGKFKVTVHGEAFLKSTYRVSKGTKKRLTETL